MHHKYQLSSKNIYYLHVCYRNEQKAYNFISKFQDNVIKYAVETKSLNFTSTAFLEGKFLVVPHYVLNSRTSDLTYA